MPCTINLQSSVTWASTILKQSPFQVSGLEPGLTWANMVLQRVLGPPMRWPFNRVNINFPISTLGGCDYAVTAPTVRWVEDMWLTDANGKTLPLTGRLSLPKSATQNRPTEMALQYDNNAGILTFRMNTVPDASYTVYADCQQKPGLMTSYANFWAPVPDEFSYVFNQFYLATAAQLTGDARAGMWRQEAIAALLGAQAGLRETEVAIFLGEWDRAMASLARNQEQTRTGQAALKV